MYNRKKISEELPQEETLIWSCVSESCKGWIRDNFAFDTVPTCPLCKSAMEKTTRMLPQLENHGHNQKSPTNGVKI
ncbi:cold-shock protein [Cohnella faecalis]|uniref:Cold-shock protein n=1 Tax=Cohnella faecalis TaxID=2315694 RepID=A0A398CG14_9BACL|nr:cold-shock protein [Cohnella faecalis]RIE02146.1 cold-shock protein [Cohnella faecalis]